MYVLVKERRFQAMRDKVNLEAFYAVGKYMIKGIHNYLLFFIHNKL